MLAPIVIDPNTFLRQHCSLPALPPIVNRLQEIIWSGRLEVAEVARLISGDPGFLSRVLKVVNSAYFGLPREIAKASHAITFLGLNEIYRMVLSLSAIDTLRIDQQDELYRFWHHSYYTALCAKYLARRYEPLLSYEELWTGAILHDIGKLVYLKFFPDHCAALVEFCQKHGCLFSEAELRLKLPASSYLGVLLCDHWRLPDVAKKACAFHSLADLESLKTGREAAAPQRLVCLANLIAKLSQGNLNEETRIRIAESTTSALGCSQQDFLIMMGDVYELETEVEAFVSRLQTA